MKKSSVTLIGTGIVLSIVLLLFIGVFPAAALPPSSGTTFSYRFGTGTIDFGSDCGREEVLVYFYLINGDDAEHTVNVTPFCFELPRIDDPTCQQPSQEMTMDDNNLTIIRFQAICGLKAYKILTNSPVFIPSMLIQNSTTEKISLNPGDFAAFHLVRGDWEII